MKRIVVTFLAALVVVLSLSGATAFPTIAVAAQSQQDPARITVYVTRTGAKYHRDGCRYLSRSKIPMSLKEAAKRFTPCRVCKPPALG